MSLSKNLLVDLMRQSIIILLLVCFSIQGIARKTSTEKKVFRAIRVESRAPVIDGVLDDPVWQNLEWESGFLQQQPYEGKDPSQETTVAAERGRRKFRIRV